MTDVRKLFRWAGGVLTAVSALITFAFGLSISSNLYVAFLVAIALALVAAGSAYIWPFVADAMRKRRWISVCVIGLFAVLFTGADVLTNFGSISGQRETNVQRLAAQDVCKGNACGTQAENQKNLKLWEDRRARLLTEKPWLATVSSEALREDVVGLSAAIRKESSRGGCGPKCRRLMRKHSQLSKRLTAAGQFSDISQNIAATRRQLASTRNETSAASDEAMVPALLQNAALTRFFSVKRDPFEARQNSNYRGANWVFAALLTLAAAGANYVGWWGIGSGTRFGSRAPPAPPRRRHPATTFVGSPSLTRLTLASLAIVILGATTVAVFDQAFGWRGLLFSAPIVFLLGSGAAWWILEIEWPLSGNER